MTPAQLIAWRAHNNMSQQALATRLKLSVRTISRYETSGPGGRPIPASLHAQLANMANKEVVEEDPVIIPATHPQLYKKTRWGYERRPEHPGYGKPLTHKARVSDLATYTPPDPLNKPSSFWDDHVQPTIDADEDE